MSHNYSFVILRYSFWNGLSFYVTDNVINASSEAAVRRYSAKEMFFKISLYSQANLCVGASFGFRPEGLQLY